jgi:hypothetical protein
LYKLLFKAPNICMLLIEKDGVRIPVAEGRAYPTSEEIKFIMTLYPLTTAGYVSS